MIKIIDNFFEDILFKNVQNHVTTKLSFKPRYLDHSKENNKDSYYGMRFELNKDPNLLKTFISQTEKKFKIKVKETHEDCGVDIRNLENFIPHVDTEIGSKINVLMMLKGPTAVTNGTVFYTKGELDIHVGFRENRAVLFPAGWVHSAHANKEPSLKRYTASLFIKDYEE
tara:strand:- start:161 stop:670 length:510 start_codon:yes stop_codon:yes gene_type:complete